MKRPTFLFALLLACKAIISCSPTSSQVNLPRNDLFVGSTPCDSLVKSSLRIPASAKCDFIKWELVLSKSTNNSNTFQLKALYGEAQPNTNGFKGGGTELAVTGKYTIFSRVDANSNLKIYSLKAGELHPALFLVEMDSNILHFTDANKKLIVGNGGWGYVLNNAQKIR